jgi:antirestriction protein ArdC
MPSIDFFRDAVSYYATLARDDACTKLPSRLNRDFGRKRFGDEGSAMEELVAELRRCLNLGRSELTPLVREDRAAYIGSWIKVLQNDQRAIFTAASYAQRAADYLHCLQKSVIA